MQNRISKSIYILPNLFTSMNLFCGYSSVVASIHHKFFEAAVAVGSTVCGALYHPIRDISPVCGIRSVCVPGVPALFGEQKKRPGGQRRLTCIHISGPVAVSIILN